MLKHHKQSIYLPSLLCSWMYKCSNVYMCVTFDINYQNIAYRQRSYKHAPEHPRVIPGFYALCR